jgi:hypothetical protein
MTLITEEVIKQLPPISRVEGEKTLLIRLYTPWVFQSWEIAEYDPEKRLCYGWVCGLENNWGYFNLDELEKIRGPYGLKIVRDLAFKPIRYRKIGS